ncbi:unnamed protein product, partial [marine sediment metagenome]
RYEFTDVIYFKGDHRKKVKSFGVARFYKINDHIMKLPLQRG